jgi:hypothetical protein
LDIGKILEPRNQLLDPLFGDIETNTVILLAEFAQETLSNETNSYNRNTLGSIGG